MSEQWRDLVKEKKLRQQAAIPEAWIISPPPSSRLNVLELPEETGLLTPREVEITESHVEDLLPKLASGAWSAVDVTGAFSKRAIIAHQVVNCLTEIFIEQALQRAAVLDEYLSKTGKVVGPLHGLPISLKDQLAMKGFETVMGYVSWIGKYSEVDAALVEILVAQGAVPFVRTNVPQTLMWPETFNNVFGRTLNPHNRSLTPGGSSGGEGALIGMRGSALGVGSDIGGSIRIPSLFNGLYGLRPSYGRVPYRGAANSMEGQDSLPSVLGPLSTSLGGIKIFMKAVIDGKPWKKDPLAVNKPWDESSFALKEHNNGHQLVFGIMWNDGNVVPHPPVLRALEITRNALIEAGHKVVDWIPYKHKEIIINARAIWASGSQEDYVSITSLTGEPLIHTMSLEQDPLAPPSFRLTAAPKTAFQLWQLHKEKRNYRQEYLDHWEATVAQMGTGRCIDAIIAPGAPYAAPPHGKNYSADFTMIWNALDYPAMVLPVVKVDATLDKVRPPHQFLSEEDKTNYESYNPETFTDAPVGIQIVGRTCEEEALIAISEIADAAIKSFLTK
ncbi:hypothetical protein Clacol_003887 [Clathrus columnatus]|uniref:amidase n=1 Tax=Clathrus columnatus TaxID=1419009 RepID=A0AAV5A872_9AGAM|nr:hypothetical protein Clacol_003887 [Clathrus columnatus]